MEPAEEMWPAVGAGGLDARPVAAHSPSAGSGSGRPASDEGGDGVSLVAADIVAEPEPEPELRPPPRSLLRELIAGPGRRAARETRQVEGREEEQQIRQDVRLFMARLRNILPFVVLFIMRYAYSHATEIAFFACYTLLLHKLNQELRTQISLKQDADRKVLSSIIVSSLATVGAALLLNEQAKATRHPLFLSFASAGDAAGLDAAAAAATATAAVDAAGSEGLAASDAAAGAADAEATAAAAAAAATDDAGLEGAAGLDLAAVMGAGLSIEDMIWQILAADVCIRLFFTALKAAVALMPWPLPAWRPAGLAFSPRLGVPLSRWLSMFGKGPQGKKAAHHHLHHPHHVHPSSLGGRASADMEGLLAEVEMSISGSGLHHHNHNHHGPARTHSPARSLGSSSQGRRVHAERCDRTSVYTRKRRIYCLLEAISLVVRSILPVPAWFAYYIADRTYGDVFVWIYLTFKCMVISRHSSNVLAALKLALTSTLEFGRVATKEEIQEAGVARDCPICYESLVDADRSVILPCSHFFCEACCTEWLDRERSCPVCRSAVQPNFVEGWMRSRSGSTSALPCIL